MAALSLWKFPGLTALHRSVQLIELRLFGGKFLTGRVHAHGKTGRPSAYSPACVRRRVAGGGVCGSLGLAVALADGVLGLLYRWRDCLVGVGGIGLGLVQRRISIVSRMALGFSASGCLIGKSFSWPHPASLSPWPVHPARLFNSSFRPRELISAILQRGFGVRLEYLFGFVQGGLLVLGRRCKAGVIRTSWRRRPVPRRLPPWQRQRPSAGHRHRPATA